MARGSLFGAKLVSEKGGGFFFFFKWKKKPKKQTSLTKPISPVIRGTVWGIKKRP